MWPLVLTVPWRAAKTTALAVLVLLLPAGAVIPLLAYRHLLAQGNHAVHLEVILG